MSGDTRYFDASEPLGCFDVVFIVNSSGAKLVKRFKEYRQAMIFVYEAMRSKRITLVMYPNR